MSDPTAAGGLSAKDLLELLPLAQSVELLRRSHVDPVAPALPTTPSTNLDAVCLDAVCAPGAVEMMHSVLTSILAVETLCSRPDVVALLGSGPFVAAHVGAVARHLSPVDVVRWSPPGASQEVSASRGARSAQEAVADADVVILNPAPGIPMLEPDWLRDGVVLLRVGPTTSQARGVSCHLLAHATVVVEDVSAALSRSGPVQAAFDAGLLSKADIATLGATLVQGLHRSGSARWTYYDSVGSELHTARLDHVVMRRAVGVHPVAGSGR